MQEVTIDLKRPPSDRWVLNPVQIKQARELLACYKRDLGISLPGSMQGLVGPENWLEIESLSHQLGLPVEDVVLGNFYYDALKAVLGCTAFAVETADGILHARNLDWWGPNSLLARFSVLCHFKGATAGDFITVGWPAFIGAFSGVAPGRFAVTLNAVLSFDPIEIAPPVVLLLRKVLETCPSFEDAALMLSTTPIPSDCLLLLTGTRSGEMIVIERTPTRHAIRRAARGFISVTNNYQSLDIPDVQSSELQITSCGRQRRIEELLRATQPSDAETALRYLSDPAIKMSITVQQMVFCAATGMYAVETSA